MKKIIVTTDLSGESVNAFETARKIVTAFHAHLTILAVVEDPAQAAMMYALDYPVIPGQEVQDQLRIKVQQDLEELRKQHFEGLDVAVRVLDAQSSVHQTIVSFAENESADLVIMASHGRTGIARFLIGSVVDRVIRECPCPILTVPPSNEGISDTAPKNS